MALIEFMRSTKPSASHDLVEKGVAGLLASTYALVVHVGLAKYLSRS